MWTRFTFHKLHLKESSVDTPCEGIFWLIDDEIVSFDNPVTISGMWSNTIEHSKLWPEISSRYKVDNQTVPYNYFPRGRVMVNPIKDDNGKFLHYDAYIYIDNCINNEDVLDDIKYTFRLNKPNVNIKYVGGEGGITSDHYTCHNCK